MSLETEMPGDKPWGGLDYDIEYQNAMELQQVAFPVSVIMTAQAFLAVNALQ